MKNREKQSGDQDGLGPELERLLAAVPPPKAPAWFTTRTLARLRSERADRSEMSWFSLPRLSWAMGAVVCILLVTGIVRRDKTVDPMSDAAIFAGLNALVEQEADNRWWAGL